MYVLLCQDFEIWMEEEVKKKEKKKEKKEQSTRSQNIREEMTWTQTSRAKIV